MGNLGLEVIGSIPAGENIIGKIKMVHSDGTSVPYIGSLSSDIIVANFNGLAVSAVMRGYDGANAQLWRNNLSGTLLASAARTASVQSSDQTNYNGRGLFIHIKVTAVTATPSIAVAIEGKNAAGVYFNLLTSAAITTVSDNLLIVAPWAAETANVSTAKMVPRTWRVNVTAADADEITYGVYYDLGV